MQSPFAARRQVSPRTALSRGPALVALAGRAPEAAHGPGAAPNWPGPVLHAPFSKLNAHFCVRPCRAMRGPAQPFGLAAP